MDEVKTMESIAKEISKEKEKYDNLKKLEAERDKKIKEIKNSHKKENEKKDEMIGKIKKEYQSKISELIRKGEACTFNDAKKFIEPLYQQLIKLTIEQIKKTNLKELDIEEYIKPEGICEGIAIGIGFLDALKKTQLRKFFDQIKDLEHRLKSNEDLNKIKIEVLTLIPKLAYSKGRKLIDDEFYNFMKALLLRLKNDMNEKDDKEDVFEKFVNILESVLAYYTYHFPKEE
jgi:CRISPR-associated protein, Csm2 family